MININPSILFYVQNLYLPISKYVNDKVIWNWNSLTHGNLQLSTLSIEICYQLSSNKGNSKIQQASSLYCELSGDHDHVVNQTDDKQRGVRAPTT